MPELKSINIDGTSYTIERGTVDNALSDSSENPVQNKVIKAALDNKVEVISGKGLSTNDFTNDYKSGLDNGVTNSNFITKMDSQITILTNIAKKLGWSEWLEIQKLVRAGTFAQQYSVGDQLIVKYYGNDMLWNIVAIDVAMPADTSKTHSVTLMPYYLLPDYMTFDNREPNNSDSDRMDFGNNRYKDSNIRLWLNSDGAAGSWWTAQHSADAAPDYATTKAGFMNGFDADFLEVIGETKIKVVKPDVDGGGYEELVDKFYLPSTTEIGLANENNIAEGALFPYFSSNTQRTKSRSGSSAGVWWLRTPDSMYSNYVSLVNSSGMLGGYYAYEGLEICPVCNII